MGSPTVVVLDYGSGNVHSAATALEAVGARVQLTADARAVTEADGLIVPGVGAFAAVMAALNIVNAHELIDRRLAGGRSVLGICAGMQVLFDKGTEGGGDVAGLGQWPGEVVRLESNILPHMGWNTVDAPQDSVLFAGVRTERFYFVHSYAALQWPMQQSPAFPAPALTWAEYGSRFLAAVENGPLSATQFHPEKSGTAGLRLLSNWVGALRRD